MKITPSPMRNNRSATGRSFSIARIGPSFRTVRRLQQKAPGGTRCECRRAFFESTSKHESERHLNLPRAADRMHGLTESGGAGIKEVADKWIAAVGRTGGSRGHGMIGRAIAHLRRSRAER